MDQLLFINACMERENGKLENIEHIMPVDKTAQCDSCLDISSITICLNHEL
jgi:hypothetical protein